MRRSSKADVEAKGRLGSCGWFPACRLSGL